MTRTEYTSCWYGEALPSGEFAILSLSGLTVLTHLGALTLSVPGPLYTRITNVEGFKICGQVNDGTNRGMSYADGLWTVHPNVAYGVSGAIYDRLGVLHLSAGPGVGSQGWRFVRPDNTLVTGDETYYSPSMGLSEWTDLGDGLFIGQASYGHDECVIYDGTHLRLLDPAPVRFIRANRVGDNVAIVYWIGGGNTHAVRIMCSVHELMTLPVWSGAGAPVPVPVPTPVPVPPPPTGDKPMRSDLKSEELVNLSAFTEQPHPAGQGLVALKTSSNRFKSLTPRGTWDPDKLVTGPWEAFLPYGGVYLAARNDGSNVRTFIAGTRLPDTVPAL